MPHIALRRSPGGTAARPQTELIQFHLIPLYGWSLSEVVHHPENLLAATVIAIYRTATAVLLVPVSAVFLPCRYSENH